MSFMDAEVNEKYAEQILPPIIQWKRGDLTNSVKALKNGCWELPAEYWESAISNKAKPVDIVHGTTVVPAYIFAELNFAVLAYRKFWFIQTDDDTRRILAPGEFEEGAKSKYLLWVIVKELDNAQAIVTTAGLNAKNLQIIYANFHKQIIGTANRLAGKQFARYHFWMPVTNGPKEDTKQGQYITPPALGLNGQTINKNLLNQLYTPGDVHKQAEASIEGAQDWADYSPVSNNSDIQKETQPPEPEAPPVVEDEIPF